LETVLKGLDKPKVMAAARELGLALAARPKDARSKVIRRLARLILDAPAERRSEMLEKLRLSSDPQTEGWFELIRRGE
jgi:hypothetical protein